MEKRMVGIEGNRKAPHRASRALRWPVALVASLLAAACGSDGGSQAPQQTAGQGGVGGSSGAPQGGASGSAGKAGGDPCAGKGCDDGIGCTLDTCQDGQCRHAVGPNSGSTACPQGQFFTTTHGCIAAPACANDQQCVAIWKDDPCKANPRCEAASSVCVFEPLDKDHDGHAPTACGGDDCDDGDGSLFPGNAEFCDGKDNDCDGQVDDQAFCSQIGFVCLSGTCQCKPENLCGGACVDKAVDPLNCGDCGVACKPGASCAKGACACPAGTVDCGDACANTIVDPGHCGGCGKACTGGMACKAGACACAEGEALCGGTCVDTQGDPKSCGGCGKMCPPGTGCSTGACQCPAAKPDLCPGPPAACVDFGADAKNCGGCGVFCPTGCQGGKCADCPVGFGDCDGDGSNGCEAKLSSSQSNCGQCGKACNGAMGEVCQNGTCISQTSCVGAPCSAAPSCYDLQTDPLNCGACGKACDATKGEACSEGSCVAGAGGSGGAGGASGAAGAGGAGSGGLGGGSGAAGESGAGGAGSGGASQACQALGATDCFSNYDCPDPADRCDPDAFCCVEGKRGTGKAGEACSNGTDCKSGLCVDGGASGVACTDKCATEADCPDGMKTCAPLGLDGFVDGFCLPKSP